MSQQPQQAAPAFGDALVTFEQIARDLFLPRPGRTAGITRNGLAKMIAGGRFPAPIKLGTGPKAALRWRLSDLRAWLEQTAPQHLTSTTLLKGSPHEVQ